MMTKTEWNFECHRNTKHANRLILLYKLEKKTKKTNNLIRNNSRPRQISSSNTSNVTKKKKRIEFRDFES